ncbi:MAG TPA: hypothetical protein VKE22_01290 [Haliangiales bacterium]|nr:hypothetical protein [Haliangiales bacterium]
MTDEERPPFVLRWVLLFGAGLVATAMTLMVIFLRQPKPPPLGTPALERQGEYLVCHPAGRGYLILASAQDGRVTIHIPRRGAGASALVDDQAGIPLADLPHGTIYAFFSLHPISVGTVMSRLARGVEEVPEATTVVFRW